MTIGAVADIHGNFDALTQRHGPAPGGATVAVRRRSRQPYGAYPETSRPLYWIKGNNEDFDRIARWEAGAEAPPHLRYIKNGTAAQVGPLTVAGLGGTFAPTWFETAAVALPHTPKDDKRRHFVREEAEACKLLRGVDILMTHEAARPFIIVDDPKPGAKPRRHDAGKPAINDVLATLRPRLHLCGHHHRFTETTREGVPSVCIDRVNRSVPADRHGDAEVQEDRAVR